MLATAAANAIFQEVKKEDSFFKINTKVESGSKDSPSSPTDSNFTAPSMHESEDGFSSFGSIETTDSLFRVLESMHILSELSIFFLVLMGINLIFILVEFDKIKWINSKPKLLKFLNKFKTARKSLLLVQLFLILISLIMIDYGLNGIINELLRVKTFIK